MEKGCGIGRKSVKSIDFLEEVWYNGRVGYRDARFPGFSSRMIRLRILGLKIRTGVGKNWPKLFLKGEFGYV